jgi:OOP family OmpA-OmpF porin
MGTAPSRDLGQQRPPDSEFNREYTRLRELLVGPEQLRLEELRRRLDDRQLRTEDLSQVVAEAIALRARRDRALQQALNPLVEEAVRVSVVRNPAILADALFPVIGEAVRKAVAHALNALVESINQTLERSVSLDAFKWRIEALRTGRPFGEVVLARSIRYRVEQVFLIHRETGLLLQHLARPDQVVQDSDLVSGMLTAIQDFVRDSFGRGIHEQEIETIELGEFKLWVLHGPVAILAVVVSGTPPSELRHILERTLERLHAEFGALLTSFDGSTDAFATTRPLLQSCLLGRQAHKSHPRPVFFIVLAAAMLLALSYGVFAGMRNYQRWNRFVNQVRREPGIVLTSADRSWRSYRLTGLRDPFAIDPDKLMRACGINPASVSSHWEPYVSLDPKFKSLRQFEADKSALEQAVVRFPLNSVQLSSEQLAKIDDIEVHLTNLQQDGASIGKRFVIELQGHTDPIGNEGKNETLSERRAEEVAKELHRRGISNDLFRTVAMGSREPVRGTAAELSAELNRRVTFHVLVLNEASR